MQINGKTVILASGRITRVCSRRFNQAVRRSFKGAPMVVLTEHGERIEPSKGLSWVQVGLQVRAGKSVQARLLK
jgi:hypothetical protein